MIVRAALTAALGSRLPPARGLAWGRRAPAGLAEGRRAPAGLAEGRRAPAGLAKGRRAPAGLAKGRRAPAGIGAARTGGRAPSDGVVLTSEEATRLLLPGAGDPAALEVYDCCLVTGAESRLPPARPDGERLEFFGDAVLYLSVAEMLLDSPGGALTPGEMHRARFPVLSNRHLAGCGRAAGIASLVRESMDRRGARRGGGGPAGPPSDKRVADAVEALLGAVYLVGGKEAAKDWLRAWVLPRGFAGAQRSEGETSSGVLMGLMRTRTTENTDA